MSTCMVVANNIHHGSYGSFQKSRALIQTPNSRALFTRMPTKRTPNSKNSHTGVRIALSLGQRSLQSSPWPVAVANPQ